MLIESKLEPGEASMTVGLGLPLLTNTELVCHADHFH